MIAHGAGGSFDELFFLVGAVVFVAGVVRLLDRQGPGRRWVGLPMMAAAVGLAALPFLAGFGGAKQAKVRIASTAKIAVVQPRQGQRFTGREMHVVISLRGGTIDASTSTTLRPDRGHMHLSIDGTVLTTNGELESDVPLGNLRAGVHLLQAEFVATDHGPFAPRVVATTTFVMVR